MKISLQIKERYFNFILTFDEFATKNQFRQSIYTKNVEYH